MKNKFLITLAAMVMVLVAFFAVTASAATYGDLTYEISNGEVTITYCDSSATSVVIPETIDGYPVTTIGDSAFEYCYSLMSVTIPDSVTYIGDYAFFLCESLTSVTIPDSVTTIGEYAFSRTAYFNDASNWENGILYIDNHLIKAETSISGAYTIKEGIVTIAGSAFSDCDSLTSVTIPDSETTICERAFSDCESLTNISVEEDNPNYSSEDGVLFNKTKTTLIACPGGKSGTYVVPSTVTTIGDSAFYGCWHLTSVTIPSSVTTIGDSAFSLCVNLTSVTIPSSVTTIGDSAFFLCESLTSVTIPDSVTTIGGEAFSWCDSLTSVTIPSSVTYIGYSAFSSCSSLTDIYYGGTQKDWEKMAIGPWNDDLLNATIHFTDPPEETRIPGDVDGNGKVDTKDIILIRRFIAGGYDVELK